MKEKRVFPGGFTPWEAALWCASVTLITVSFFAFGQTDYLTLSASLIGVTSLILNAKGNPLGQLLIIVFSILYGIISFSAAYYGEMITYLGMSGPMALLALITWLKNPYEGRRAEVAVSRLRRGEVWILLTLTAAVTAVFYFILAAFRTAQLPLSTLSVTTSFAAAYLTWRRSAYFALAYAANDAVLIALWILAAAGERGFISVIICFLVFLVNDLYGFISWRRMQRRQER